MREVNLQIKPVGNHCNLCCKYCYAKPFKSKEYGVLSIELLEKLIKEACELTNNIIISWHGGEPLLAGLDFYKKYIEIVNKYKKNNQNIVNIIQTNATLITDEFAKFLSDNNFIVSISLDGIKKCHNINRYDYKENGSFEMVMKGVMKLRKYGIFPPVICTVSKSTYDYCIENFDFFVNNGFREIKYSPVYDSVSDNFSISSDEWFEYINNVFYRWLELKNMEIKVREIDELLMWYSNKTLNLCSSTGRCLNWVSIDELGNYYPCEYLRASKSYGNIKLVKLEDVFKTKEYSDFKEEVLTIPDECQKCELFSLCHNGCPATRVKDNVLTYKGKYVYCEERKKLYFNIKKEIS